MMMVGQTFHPFRTVERHHARVCSLFIQHIYIDLFRDSFELIDYRSAMFICYLFLGFFLVNDSMRVLSSFPDRWVIRRGTPFPPPFGSLEALPWRRHLRIATTATSTALGHQKKCLYPLRRFQTRALPPYGRTFFHPEMHGSMISIRFLGDVYWEKGGDRVRGCMSVRVGERDLFQRRLWEGGRVFCVIHKSIITKRNVKRDVCRSDEILFYKLMRMIPKFILVYIWFNAKFLNKNFKFWVLFFFCCALFAF